MKKFKLSLTDEEYAQYQADLDRPEKEIAAMSNTEYTEYLKSLSDKKQPGQSMIPRYCEQLADAKRQEWRKAPYRLKQRERSIDEANAAMAGRYITSPIQLVQIDRDGSPVPVDPNPLQTLCREVQAHLIGILDDPQQTTEDALTAKGFDALQAGLLLDSIVDEIKGEYRDPRKFDIPADYRTGRVGHWLFQLGQLIERIGGHAFEPALIAGVKSRGGGRAGHDAAHGTAADKKNRWEKMQTAVDDVYEKDSHLTHEAVCRYVADHYEFPRFVNGENEPYSRHTIKKHTRLKKVE